MLQLAEINRPPIVIPTPAPSSLDSILKEEEFWLALTKVLQGYLGTVCWIEVRVALLCAQQYVPWNLLIIEVLNNFWYFKHQILTRICSEVYLKQEIILRNYNFLLLSETISSIMFQICYWGSPSWDLVFEISKIIQNFDYRYISGHVLLCTQNCHLNSNSTHCVLALSEKLPKWHFLAK